MTGKEIRTSMSPRENTIHSREEIATSLRPVVGTEKNADLGAEGVAEFPEPEVPPTNIVLCSVP